MRSSGRSLKKKALSRRVFDFSARNPKLALENVNTGFRGPFEATLTSWSFKGSGLRPKIHRLHRSLVDISAEHVTGRRNHRPLNNLKYLLYKFRLRGGFESAAKTPVLIFRRTSGVQLLSSLQIKADASED